VPAIAGIFFITMMWGAATVQAQCHGTKPVTFPAGFSSTVIKGTIPASKAVCYDVRARAGQTLTVKVDSLATGVRFTVIPEGDDVEPLAQDTKSWESVLEETGTYTISVHAPRPGSVFTLDISISGTLPRTTSRTTTTSTCGNFSGTYLTDYGPLRLTRTGDQVRGTYTIDSDKDSTVSGTVRGNVLSGRWTEPSGKGTFRFTLASDGRSFKGSFAPDGEAASGSWNGHCGNNSH
jgi:hypothetical protein